MNVNEVVIARILEALEAGTVPWRRPWDAAAGQAVNWVSRKPYRGVNVFLLPAGGEYLTFNQAKAAGGSVKKGAKGHMVVFFKPFVKKNEQGEEERTGGALLRYYTVFSIADCEGIASKTVERVHQPQAEAEALVANWSDKPSIGHGGDCACYMPAIDHVQMPPHAAFFEGERYYATLFPELVHSTGYKTRLDRFGKATDEHFGSESYSREELVAEVGAAMLCMTVGIDNTMAASASYIASWMGRLKGDSTLIVQAASAAQKAVDLIVAETAEEEVAA